MRRRLEPTLLPIAIVLVSGTASISPSFGYQFPPEVERKLDPVLRQQLEAETYPRPVAPVLPGGRADILGEGAAIPCWVRFDPAQGLPEWIRAEGRTTSSGIARVRLSVDEAIRLAGHPGTLGIAAARRAHPLLDVSVPEIGADEVHTGTGVPPAYTGLTGAGVIVGVIDTGMDVEHPDFTTPTGTRVVALWDQTASPSISPPSGFSYGREWAPAQIDAGFCTETDDDGHGTHVLGTAAGNGSSTGNGKPAYRYVGVAPEASIVFVKTDFYTASIVDAIDYIFQQADIRGMPAVVNLSLGHHYGPHDGRDDSDLAISSLAGPGRIVVAAAGNEQEDGIHAETIVPASGTSDVTFRIWSYSPSPGASNDYMLIDAYYSAAATLSVRIHTPNGLVVGPVAAGSKTDINTADGGVYLENDWYDPPDEPDKNLFIQIYDKSTGANPISGIWTIEFEDSPALSPAAAAEVDLWVCASSFPTEPQFVTGMTAEELVASPACADSVIAVAAYVTRKSWKSVDGNTYQYSSNPTVGGIAAFSSHGPRRDGQMKPDVAAPGMGIGAALSSQASEATPYILDDGVHFITQGTSMAAPHVTGLAALMLQIHGPLSVSELLSRMRETARADVHTGSIPNATWGSGKIDAVGATTTTTPVEIGPVRVRRGPDGIRIEWTVPEDLASMEFRVLRQVDGADPVELSLVGPGPAYSVLDPALVESGAVSYWLVALGGGESLGRFGPYTPEEGDPPVEFELQRAWPNPAPGVVNLAIRIPLSGLLRLEVLDAAGRCVQRVRNGNVGPGTHRYQWDGCFEDGREAPGGVYWLRAEWEGEVRSGKVLLLRR